MAQHEDVGNVDTATLLKEVLAQLSEHRSILEGLSHGQKQLETQMDMLLNQTSEASVPQADAPQALNTSIVADSQWVSNRTAYGLIHHRHASQDDAIAGAREADTPDDSKRGRWIKSARFDILFGTIIVIDMILLALELEFAGRSLDGDLGFREGSGVYQDHKIGFYCLEWAFLAAYFLEFILRFWANGRSYCHSGYCLLDVFILVTSTISTSLAPTGMSMPLARALRVFRLCRVLRIAKLVRLIRSCHDFYIIWKTVSSSWMILAWSMLFMAGCISAASFVLRELLDGFLKDESQSFTKRVWVYENFGTFSRTFLSLFEAAFTARWTTFMRTMIDDVHWLFSVFWAAYVVLVNFAIVRILSAMMLKQTLAVSRIEEERLTAKRLEERKKIAALLHRLFMQADTSGDGRISAEELNVLVNQDDIVRLFHELDIEIEEIEMLFDLLSEDDGFVDWHEFLTGASQLKNSARTVDTIQILHQLLVMGKSLKLGLAEMEARIARSPRRIAAPKFTCEPQSGSVSSQKEEAPRMRIEM